MSKGPNVWGLVGMVMAIYAALVLGAGIYYIFQPFKQVRLYHLNPSLWWGMVMALTSAFMLIVGRKKGQ